MVAYQRAPDATTSTATVVQLWLARLVTSLFSPAAGKAVSAAVSGTTSLSAFLKMGVQLTHALNNTFSWAHGQAARVGMQSMWLI